MKKITMSNTTEVFIIDNEDFLDVSSHSWHIHQGYPRTTIKGKSVSIHKFLMGSTSGENIDHINCDKLDNRRCNLRKCTPAQNRRNVGKRKDNITGYKGVSIKTEINKFRSVIRFNGKQIHLGYFDNPEDAARAYDDAAKKYHGEFARTNFYTPNL